MQQCHIKLYRVILSHLHQEIMQMVFQTQGQIGINNKESKAIASCLIQMYRIGIPRVIKWKSTQPGATGNFPFGMSLVFEKKAPISFSKSNSTRLHSYKYHDLKSPSVVHSVWNNSTCCNTCTGREQNQICEEIHLKTQTWSTTIWAAEMLPKINGGLKLWRKTSKRAKCKATLNYQLMSNLF